MALSAGSEITLNDINDLKSRVKAEMIKRTYQGSLNVAPYNTDFSITPGLGQLIKAEHYNETVGYISAISPITGYTSSVSAGDVAYALQAASLRLTENSNYSTEHMTDDATDCNALCTGLCHTACHGTCRGGCQTGCTGCSGTCSGTCQGCTGCTNACTSCQGCSGSCSGGCQGGCGTACNKWCGGSCWIDYCYGNASYY